MDVVNHIKMRVERSQARTILSALLQAIFFHRVLDNIDPETLDVLDTHVACAPNKEIDREVAAKVEEFVSAFVEAGADSGEIAVVFLQRKHRRAWFATTETLVPWEEHLITMTFVTRVTTNPLPAALLQLLTFCAEHKANVPPLVGASDQNNLSHQIFVSPPTPTELFAPSSPPGGPRFGSPQPTSTPVAPEDEATEPLAAPRAPALAGDPPRRAGSPMAAISDAGTSAMGYLGQAKDGLLAVSAKAGWGARK